LDSKLFLQTIVRPKPQQCRLGRQNSPSFLFEVIATKLVKQRHFINRDVRTNKTKKEKIPMYPEDPIKPKRSLGALRKANKTKPKSPDVQGTMKAQRHTIAALTKQLTETQGDEITCNLARWFNKDSSGQYLTVELSPRYIPRQREEPINMFETFFQEKEDVN
jgi:hypothetical protein